MAFKDLREFIDKLEEEGEAQRIDDEVNWDLEAGAMVRRSNERGLPSPFFQKLTGYPDGYRIFGSPLTFQKRIAIAMNMDRNTPAKELIDEYIRRKRHPLKPLFVSTGPCKENIHIGNEVDLLEFPVPKVHHGDGGRYIGTFHLTITKDLDSDWVNWGMYRIMVQDRNTLGIMAGPSTHFGMMHRKSCESRNAAMEVAIAIGTEPISNLCSASPIPYGISEVDVAGGVRGEPVELAKCETVNLFVPATSEIVIEGEILPDEKMDEGPFGEFTGYMVAPKQPRSVIHVKAVTHRNNPILTMSCVGVPPDDNTISSITKAADFLEALKAQGLPISGVCVFPETSNLLTVVSVKPTYSYIAEDIAHILWGSRGGHIAAYLIIVNDDVDPFNIGEVLHALVTKCHPNRGIVKLEHSPAMPLAPYLNLHERRYRLGAKVYFDCTWPLDWAPAEVPKRVSFKDNYPAEVQQSALAMWKKYGY